MGFHDDDATSYTYNTQSYRYQDRDYSRKKLPKHEAPLTRNGKIVLITHTLSLLIINAFEVVGYTTPEWVITKVAGGEEMTYGLWQSCKESPAMKKTCLVAEWGKLKDYHMVGLAFMSMALMLDILGCSIILVFFFINDRAQNKLDLCCRPVVKLKMTMSMLVCSRAMLGVAAVGFFYSSYIKDSPQIMVVTMGYSSILIIIGSILTIPVLLGFSFGLTYHRVREDGQEGSHDDMYDNRGYTAHSDPTPTNPSDDYSTITVSRGSDQYDDSDSAKYHGASLTSSSDDYSNIPASDGGFAEGGDSGEKVYTDGSGDGGGYPPMTPAAMMMPSKSALNY